MGRPLGSANKQRPFRVALNIALHARPLALRRIADQLLDRAEGGDLAAAREIIDRLDGRAAQTVEYGDLPVSELTDAQLHEIACRSWDENGPPVRMLSPPQR